MSIIQTVRDKGMWVVSVAIALSVIGFLLMDARSGNKGRGAGGADEVIGSVNGQNITRARYLELEKMMEDGYASQGRPVDEASHQQIRQQVWSQLSDGTALDQEIERLGFALTDKEINDEMFGSNPPEFLKQEFTSKENGQFDAVAARNAINQLKKGKNTAQKQQFEKTMFDPYVEGLLRKKYFTLLQASSYVPKWMVEKQMADNNAIASFQYVAVPYSTIADSTIKISDDQINTYVKAHSNEYKQEEASRSVAYVNFEVKPTTADSAATKTAITNLKAEFETTNDPAGFVTRNSTETAFYPGYNGKAKLMMPAKDSILATGVGKVYGPYMDGNAWVMSRIIDVKILPDSVKVRHILIGTIDPQTQQPIRDEATAKAKIDSIFTAIKAGADFNMMVLQFSDDQGSKMKGGVYDFFPQGQMVSEFNDSSFQGKVGDYKVVKTQFGYHLINILAQKGLQPAYKIAYMAKNIVASPETTADILAKANMFAGNSRSLKAFDENVKKENLVRLVSSEIKDVDFSIPGIGENRPLVRWIFDNDPGEVSEPQDMKDKYVVVAVTGAEEPGLASATKARPAVEPILRNAEKAKTIKAKAATVSTLDAWAAAQGQKVQRADSVGFTNPTIPGSGPELKIVATAFNKANLNKSSQPLEGSGGVYAIMPVMIGAKVPATPTNVEEQKKQMESQMKQSIAYSAISGLRKAANIKDKRSTFL
ncbi:MAG: peptidylprolyl isomerase [Chitinophagaceae bacterium]